MASVSHFDEKSGIVPFTTEWGRWWQTMDEVHVELTNLDNIKSRDVSVKITPTSIECTIRGKTVLQVLKSGPSKSRFPLKTIVYSSENKVQNLLHLVSI